MQYFHTVVKMFAGLALSASLILALFGCGSSSNSDVGCGRSQIMPQSRHRASRSLEPTQTFISDGTSNLLFTNRTGTGKSFKNSPNGGIIWGFQKIYSSSDPGTGEVSGEVLDLYPGSGPLCGNTVAPDWSIEMRLADSRTANQRLEVGHSYPIRIIDTFFNLDAATSRTEEAQIIFSGTSNVFMATTGTVTVQSIDASSMILRLDSVQLESVSYSNTGLYKLDSPSKGAFLLSGTITVTYTR